MQSNVVSHELKVSRLPTFFAIGWPIYYKSMPGLSDHPSSAMSAWLEVSTHAISESMQLFELPSTKLCLRDVTGAADKTSQDSTVAVTSAPSAAPSGSAKDAGPCDGENAGLNDCILCNAKFLEFNSTLPRHICDTLLHAQLPLPTWSKDGKELLESLASAHGRSRCTHSCQVLKAQVASSFPMSKFFSHGSKSEV